MIYGFSLALLLHLFFLVHTRFTLWPEMAVYPYLFNKGFILYKDIITPYPPALVLILSKLTSLNGYSIITFQVFTWSVILILDCLIFVLVTKITKKLIYGLFATLFFIIISIPFEVNGLWFDLIQTPLILISFFYFYKFLESEKHLKLFYSIFFITLAFFIKQQVVWVGLWYLIALLVFKKLKLTTNYYKYLLILIPPILIFSFHLIYYWKIGLLSDFIFWNINFPLFKTSTAPGYLLLPTLKQLVVTVFLFLLFSPILFSKSWKNKFILYTSVFLVILSYPRFGYFHLIPSLSILAILSGPLMSQYFKANFKQKITSLVALTFLIAFSLRFYIINWHLPVRFFEADIITAARTLTGITKPNDIVLIQNGPDQLFPLTQTLPPKPWAIQLPMLLELDGMQKTILTGIKKDSPNFVVFKPYRIGRTYDLGSYKPKALSEYLETNYETRSQISETLWLRVRK